MTEPPVNGDGVFINCPFDSSFRSCHDAILLCVVSCGLEPPQCSGDRHRIITPNGTNQQRVALKPILDP